MKYIKDSLFDGIKSQIFSMEKQKNRTNMVKYGFIIPQHITKLDFLLSMTKNQDEENYIKEQEKIEDTEIND